MRTHTVKIFRLTASKEQPWAARRVGIGLPDGVTQYESEKAVAALTRFAAVHPAKFGTGDVARIVESLYKLAGLPNDAYRAEMMLSVERSDYYKVQA